MTAPQAVDVVVLGGGPGGYVASLRAAQLGLSVACVEADATLGGTCVNVGCIPSKALLQSSEHYDFIRRHAAEHGIRVEGVALDLPAMMARKAEVVAQNTKGVEFLFRKNKVTWARGFGTLRPGNVVEVRAGDGAVTAWQGRSVILATGSVPVQLPFLPFDEERVLSNVGALSLPEVPRRLLVVGGGVIGLELGSVWRRLGAEVEVVEFAPTILPGNDEELVREADKVFRKQGLVLHTGTRVTGAEVRADGVTLTVEKDGVPSTLSGDHVLVSVGRKPSLGGVDAAALGLALGARGEVLVDDQQRTNLPGVYAIGDLCGGKLLAHKAEEEGVVAAEVIAGKASHMHHHLVPGIVYTWPELATVGLTEQEVKASGRPYRVGKFPFSANGRARTMGETQGFVKFVVDRDSDELLGAHMIGPNVADLMAEVVLAMAYRASAEDIGMTVHAHPTLSEVTKEAALAAVGRALHMCGGGRGGAAGVPGAPAPPEFPLDIPRGTPTRRPDDQRRGGVCHEDRVGSPEGPGRRSARRGRPVGGAIGGAGRGGTRGGHRGVCQRGPGGHRRQGVHDGVDQRRRGGAGAVALHLHRELPPEPDPRRCRGVRLGLGALAIQPGVHRGLRQVGGGDGRQRHLAVGHRTAGGGLVVVQIAHQAYLSSSRA
jgi:dihydrolipoamide dehydrogenase